MLKECAILIMSICSRKAEDVLEQMGYSTAHHMLHNVISDVNAEIEWCILTIQSSESWQIPSKKPLVFRHILVELKDGGL